ncbi:uncharacterized protein LOC108109731 isoform X2 [Drosophila eugracilis]|uniref:uncharacterized protein LOC108109731 isoform X2 n=1 Tax=Drosophila eugracilis TaxID=29029 RepID=UPI0007E65639|nr:uncharacterized protein LOC108109731 isoform X2 [Drosophila eugracilis]
MDNDDDVVEVVDCDSSLQEEINAKLVGLRKFVPFIQRVRMNYQYTLSEVQAHRLDALVGLLERENISMSTLNKIELIIEKLKKRFKLRVPLISEEVIEIKDQNEVESAASTPFGQSGSAAQIPDKEPHPSHQAKSLDASVMLEGIKIPSSAVTKPKSLDVGCKTNGFARHSSAAIEATPALPTAPESKSSSSGCLTNNKTPGFLSKTKPLDPVPNLKSTSSLYTSKNTMAQLKNDGLNSVSETLTSPRVAVQAQHITPPTIPEPASAPATSYKKSESLPSHGIRGVLAAMQEARMEEKKERASAQLTLRSTKESIISASKETNVSRRSLKLSPQFTRRSLASSMPAEKPDFVRRSAPHVLPVSPQQGTTRLPEKDLSTSLSLQESPALERVIALSPSNTLEEARKKLAALRGGSGAGIDALPLASNINDPRGKKILNMPSIIRENNTRVPPVNAPPTIRTPSPVPPAPSMRNGTWTQYANIPNVQCVSEHNSESPGDSRVYGASFNKEPNLEQRPFYGSDSREPRDPRNWQKKPSHMHQQLQQQPQKSQIPPYSNDPRRASSIYNGYEDSPNSWQPNTNNNNNQNANSNGNLYNKSSWSGKKNGNMTSTRGGNAHGFNGSHSFRGGHRGGHSNRSFSNPSSRFERQTDVPRTYGEHRKAKARAEAEAKARAEAEAKARAEAEAKTKIAEEQRMLDLEVQRLLEVKEKQKLLAAEKQQNVVNSKTLTEASTTHVPELDTSYRTVTLGPLTKKLDFRIPKKTPPTAPATTQNFAYGDGDHIGCSSNSNFLTSKPCDAQKDKGTDKNKNKNLDKAKNKEMVEKGKDMPESTIDKSLKHHKPLDKKLEKEKNRFDKKDQKLDREHERKSRVLDDSSSENTDNLENEPPISKTNSSPVSELAASSPDSLQAQPALEDLGSLAPIRKAPSENNSSTSKVTSLTDGDEEGKDTKDSAEKTLKDPLTSSLEKNIANEKSKDIATLQGEGEDQPPKLSKLKIVLGPNAHTLLVNPDKSTLQKEQKITDPLVDEHDDEEVPGPSLQLLHRIMQRRNSLAPTASKPLVDKKEISTSLLYEDLQEQKRKSQNARSLANMFEKTSDNCSVSTHNIITGKRRTRGLETSFNETHLIRSCFGLGQINRSKAKGTDGNTTRAKTPAPNPIKLPEDSLGVSSPISTVNRKRRRQTICKETLDLPVETKKARLEDKEARGTPDKQPAEGDMEAQIMDVKESCLEPTSGPLSEIQPQPKSRKKTQQKRNKLGKREDIVETICKETSDSPVETIGAPIEDKETKKVGDTSDKQIPEDNIEASLMDVQESCLKTSPDSAIQPPPKPRAKARKKRNELDKLNDDIAQMYNREEVLRATGRRACTRRSRTPSQPRSSSQRSRTPSLSRASPVPDSISSVSTCSPIFIRNVARRGKAFSPGTQLSRNGIYRPQFKGSLTATKLFKVRIKRCVALEEILKKQERENNKKLDTEENKPSKKDKNKKKEIRNINPEWHSKSKAVNKCVVCSKPIRRSPIGHYMMHHKEHYAARLPPEVLEELRAGRGNRPDYSISQKRIFMLHFTCPFCQKTLLLSQLSLGDHLSAHMGEPRHQCSRCHFPQIRYTKLQRHTATCGPGAKPLSNPKNGRFPMMIHVCHLCQFVQQNKESMDRHLMEQHDLTIEQLGNVEREELLLCSTTDVPSAGSNNDGNAIIEEDQDGTAKASTSATAGTHSKSKTAKKNKQKKIKIRFKNMAKRSVRLVKQERAELEEREAQKEEYTKKKVAVPNMKIEETVTQLPLPPPEKEPVLVVNECLMDVEMDAEIEEAVVDDNGIQNKSIVVDEKPIVLLDVAAELMETETNLLDPVPVAPMLIAENVDVDDVTSQRPHSLQPTASVCPEVSLAELDGDLLDGIGSDCSDIESENEQVNSNDDDDALTDEWVDLETAKRNSKSTKSIFQVFNRICSRLKGARPGKPMANSSAHSSDGSNDVPDPSELMPRMRPLEPEPLTNEAESVATAPVPVPITATRVISPLKRVENVAFRKCPTDEEQNRASYYCVQPGCTFLFSNELEGLENHFTLEHPRIFWSGKCAICADPTTVGANLSISEELRHMRERHMVDTATVTLPSAVTVPEVVPASVPMLPKLRVRRFTGDRCVEPPVEQSQPTEVVPLDAIDQPNEMLRGLLVADHRPPNNHVDFHAAGLGEFFCSKPNSPPKEPSVEQPSIINYQSGLGLSISQVYSRDQMTANPVLSPAVQGSRPELPPAIASQEKSRNRFRCMATNCLFTAHKVMFVREHMKFHRFSFSTGYLNCSYCSHVAVDVDDYLRHGVIIHDLAPLSDLESGAEPPSVSQQILDVINQRGNANNGNLATTNATAVLTVNGNDLAAADSSSAPVSLSVAITDLLRPTGYSEDKLYACPFKNCTVRLSGEQFVIHLRYHIRSTHNVSSQVKCKYCTQMLEPPALRTHLQQAHARHSIFCAICLATAVNRRIMLYHMRNEHRVAFDLANRQLQFIPLQMQPNAVPGSTVETECFVAAVESPFEAHQMHIFHQKLFAELERRRVGTKTDFRSSEVRLLPSKPIFDQKLGCAECTFSTSLRFVLQKHLHDHKEKAIRQAYQTEEQQSVLNSEEPRTSGASSQALLQVDPSVPGIHKPLKPPCAYVPSNIRYICPVMRCSLLFSTESGLHQHMILQHKYSEWMYCQHCQIHLGQIGEQKYLTHLLMHKRHVFQCGACARHNSKRAKIERHIQDLHNNQNVDVVVHRRNDTDKTTNCRWLKAPKPSRHSQGEFICNLCYVSLPSAVQIMAHTMSVHERGYQYHCPYCTFGNNVTTAVIDHILREHPGKRVQPVQIYQISSMKNKQTIGFYCNICHHVASTFQRITTHCESKHKSRFEWQCPHCEIGMMGERCISQHIISEHPEGIGLAITQFERVINEIPDDLSWSMGQPIVEEKEMDQLPETDLPLQEQEVGPTLGLSNLGSNGESATRQFLDQPIVTDVVDLLASEDESEESSESPDELKTVEFACTHCDETNSSLEDLRTKHWALVHPDLPFYFRVQPQLLCPECKSFKGNAKKLREEHLLKVHSIRSFVAADTRRPAECAYCDYRYNNCNGLSNHISRVGHLPNDLKHVTNGELDALLLLSACGSGVNEYYQCDLCSVVMPTKSAIGQHGQVEHNKPGERFCFRQLKETVVYHCFYCMFNSTDELTTLRHMVDHYNRFKVCHFCTLYLPGGFDEYIQHCYSYHRDDVHRFRSVHPFSELKKFLMQVHFQFQNGLIITKSSLRYTRYNTETIMHKLNAELMAKVQRPPIPRLHIRLKSPGQSQLEAQGHQTAPLARIAKRRKTLNPDELLRIARQEDQAQKQDQFQALSTSAIPSPIVTFPTVSEVGNLPRLQKRRNSHVVRSGPLN